MSAPNSRGLPSGPIPSTRTMIRRASTVSTMPSLLQRTTAPESRATTPSSPVPTIGGSVRRRGTDWRCMFEPMRARFASSCSRNGMSAAATETSCFGETSMNWTFSRGSALNSPWSVTWTRSFWNRPSASSGSFACAML